MQIFHPAENLCLNTQENYFIEWLWLIILLIWVAVTILSGSMILCDRGELKCCQNKATFDFCNIFFPHFNLSILSSMTKHIILLRMTLFGDPCSDVIIAISPFSPKDGLGNKIS